ncbi:Tcd2p [Sugiyamaella lignohabitans]|uniref:Tcd2p n=1 Tax=Sugiyamaella lignohabitans TaxID=796027 RepID=A0A167F7I1_9ASCO|nr:Tcd2p [Sugiyamaella lignohabitans]ANB14909.1 Tcd2p [Sugiyamaella lignohabitans]
MDRVKTELVVGAVALGALAGVAATLGVQFWSQSRAGGAPVAGKPGSDGLSSKTAVPAHDEDLIQEQLARNIAFLGEKGASKVRNSHIVIVGVGGVGSWVATMLVRSGVGKVTLIDFDQVTLSSLNRHATATLADVGTPKVHSVAKFLNSVAPWVEITPIVALWTKDSTHLLDGASFVVDCIDNIDTKVDLLEYCYKNEIPVISSMGAGCKADPTRIRVADLSMSIEDPLSRSTRRRLRLRGITTGIPVVFSAEKPGKDKAKLLELDEEEFQKGKVDELSVLQDFRVRILPVLGPLPAIFGLTIATHLLTFIGDYTSVYDPVLGGYSLAGKQRTKFYDSAMQSLIGQAARMGWKETRDVPVDLNDIGYLIDEVFCGKTITGQCNRICLTTWDPSKPMKIGNIVPVSKEQQNLHEKEIIKGNKSLEEVYSPDTLDHVRRRLDLGLWYDRFR